MAWPPQTHQDVQDAVGVFLSGTSTIALRQSRRARAEVNALLGTTLPGSSIAAPTQEVSTFGTPTYGTTWIPAKTYDTNILTAQFVYGGANVISAGTVHPDDTEVVDSGVNSTFGGLPYSVYFAYDGARFETRMKWTNNPGTPHRVWADGNLIGTTPAVTGTPTGGELWYLVTLPDARPRNIRIDFNGGTHFGGINIESTARTIGYPTLKKGPRCIILGDSFTEGTGASDVFRSYVNRLGLHMGWGDTWASGSGGTGYLATPAGFNPPRVTFRSRVTTDVINQNPNIVIIAGGYNDYGTYTPGQVGTEAGLLFDAIINGLPNAEVIVIGPWSSKGGYQSGDSGESDAIKAQAVSRGLYFIDPGGESWITGTGRVGATTGVGNADTYISSDGIHPSDAGHAYLAARLAGHLRMLGGSGN